MKKLLVICLFLITASAFSRSWQPGSNMKDAMVNTIQKAYTLETYSNSLGFSGGNNFFGAFLSLGGSVTINMALEANTEYAFIGGGEGSASDVDIIITTPNGTVYKDDKVDNTPLVRFTTYSSGTYSIKLKLYSGTRSSFCCMSVLKSGGYTIGADNFFTAIDGIISYCNSVDNATTESVRFLALDNQWCMYGGLIGQGDDVSINTINMGYGNRTIVGAADGISTDIDLYVYRNGSTIAKDVASDAKPLVNFYATGENYEATLKNAASRGKSFVMFCVLIKY